MNEEQTVLFWAFALPMGCLLWGMVIIGAGAIGQAFVHWLRSDEEDEK